MLLRHHIERLEQGKAKTMQNQILGIYGGQIRVSLTQWEDEEHPEV